MPCGLIRGRAKCSTWACDDTLPSLRGRREADLPETRSACLEPSAPSGRHLVRVAIRHPDASVLKRVRDSDCGLCSMQETRAGGKQHFPYEPLLRAHTRASPARPLRSRPGGQAHPRTEGAAEPKAYGAVRSGPQAAEAQESAEKNSESIRFRSGPRSAVSGNCSPRAEGTSGRRHGAIPRKPTKPGPPSRPPPETERR